MGSPPHYRHLRFFHILEHCAHHGSSSSVHCGSLNCTNSFALSDQQTVWRSFHLIAPTTIELCSCQRLNPNMRCSRLCLFIALPELIQIRQPVIDCLFVDPKIDQTGDFIYTHNGKLGYIPFYLFKGTD